ncbi:hypothetical protein BDP27DRAFT_293214 [Rhodocollybia butyracea]|uniref:BHLH domain-containing protein n=1 Tax=Rhodocollybia butyracea TaxID=206335 RepID=A0A9P5PFQ2_9AGAR|nr:hypothetical protein BDP27DRAFT_293214 [Rhodocollybia butyracea]
MASTKGLVRQEGFHPEGGGSDPMSWRPSSAQGSFEGNNNSNNNNSDIYHDLASPSTSSVPIPRPHNIFDMGISSSSPASAASASASSGPNTSGFPAHFNSTLPALNSSMRYEPLPDTSPSPPINHPYANFRSHSRSQSRSRSRPPSAFNAGGPGSPNPGSAMSIGIGPQRTTRTRRGNSVSSMTSASPPPHPPPGIVIPRSGSGGEGWFGPGSQGSTGQPGEYTLPTPESLHSPGSFHGGTHGFANLSLNVSNLGLGPLGAASSPLNQYITGGGGSPIGYNLGTWPSGEHSNNNNSHYGFEHQQHHHPSHGFSHGAQTPTPASFNSHSPGFDSWNFENHPGRGGMTPLSSSLPTTAFMVLPPGPGNQPQSQGPPTGRPHAHSVSSGTPSSTTRRGKGDKADKGDKLDKGNSNSNSNSNSASNAKPLTPTEKAALLQNEKRRRRRESHNAVERRRRDNINEKIGELATLIPDVLFAEDTSNNSSQPKAHGTESSSGNYESCGR